MMQYVESIDYMTTNDVDLGMFFESCDDESLSLYQEKIEINLSKIFKTLADKIKKAFTNMINFILKGSNKSKKVKDRADSFEDFFLNHKFSNKESKELARILNDHRDKYLDDINLIQCAKSINIDQNKSLKYVSANSDYSIMISCISTWEAVKVEYVPKNNDDVSFESVEAIYTFLKKLSNVSPNTSAESDLNTFKRNLDNATSKDDGFITIDSFSMSGRDVHSDSAKSIADFTEKFVVKMDSTSPEEKNKLSSMYQELTTKILNACSDFMHVYGNICDMRVSLCSDIEATFRDKFGVEIG